MFFVRPSRFGNNKTPAARRQLQPFAMMTVAETEDFEAYLLHRRSRGRKGPLFGVTQPDGTVAPFSKEALGRIFAEALRRATGLEAATAHALRRAAVTAAYLAIHEARTGGSAGAPLIERLTGWSRAERVRVAEAIAPVAMRRDCWTGLARFAGHGNAETTFGTYVMAADLAVFDACKRHDFKRRDAERALATLGRRHLPLVSAPREKKPSSGAVVGVTMPPVEALLAALIHVDNGYTPSAAASAETMSLTFLEGCLVHARNWAGMETSRGPGRLQPKDRKGKLAPAPLPAPKKAEALGLARRLLELAQESPEETRRWVRQVLLGWSQTNAGTRLGTVPEFERWLGVALKLRPASRWQANTLRPDPVPGSALEPWDAARPEGMPGTANKPGLYPNGASIVMHVRLLSPAAEGKGGKKPADFWTGCILFATHLVAIYSGYNPRGR